jgi:CO dehydrogenase/acetyl-CoA synthase epsilon subunit
MEKRPWYAPQTVVAEEASHEEIELGGVSSEAKGLSGKGQYNLMFIIIIYYYYYYCLRRLSTFIFTLALTF